MKKLMIGKFHDLFWHFKRRESSKAENSNFSILYRLTPSILVDGCSTGWVLRGNLASLTRGFPLSLSLGDGIPGLRKGGMQCFGAARWSNKAQKINYNICLFNTLFLPILDHNEWDVHVYTPSKAPGSLWMASAPYLTPRLVGQSWNYKKFSGARRSDKYGCGFDIPGWSCPAKW